MMAIEITNISMYNMEMNVTYMEKPNILYVYMLRHLLN